LGLPSKIKGLRREPWPFLFARCPYRCPQRVSNPVIRCHSVSVPDSPQTPVSLGFARIGAGFPAPPGSRSHDFIDELQPEPGEVVIDKPGKGAFFATELDLILRTRGVTHLIVGGIATHVCVQSSLREAADRGYWSLVLEDCCASSVPELHHATFEMVKYGGGIFGQVSDSGSFLKAIAEVRRLMTG